MAGGVPSRFVSIGTKLSAFIFALLAIVFAFVYVESTEKARQSLVNAKLSAGAMVADVLAASLEAALDFGDNDAAQAELNRIAGNADVIYAAVWSAGAETPIAVLLTEGRGAITGMPASREARTTALNDRIEAVRTIEGPKGAKLGGVVVHFSLLRENMAYEERRRRLLLISVGLTFALSALLIGLARRIVLSPLMQLAEAARRMEWGTAASVNVTSDDEIGRLGGAFNAMAAAIMDRERRLASARANLQEVLDNMRQAIVVFGPGGRLEGATSRQAGVIFGEGSLDGRSIQALLYPDALSCDTEARAFQEWLSVAFDIHVDQWEELASLAPREVVLRREPGEEMVLSLEFRPFVEGDSIARVMLLATDETDKRRLERAVQSQEKKHAQQMAAMRRLVASGAQLFLSFLGGVKDRLARSKALLEETGGAPRPLSATAIDEIFQNVHTIKGEARAFEMRDLEAEAASIEERLAEMRSTQREGKPLTSAALDLKTRLDHADDVVTHARRMFVDASPIGAAVLDQVSVSQTALLRVLEIIDARRGAKGLGLPQELVEAVATLASRPFGESAAQLVEAVPGWAVAKGKQAEIELEGREVLLPQELSPVLRGALTHLVRNAVAHGIERPDERERLGKPVVGKIRVRCLVSAPAGAGAGAGGTAAGLRAFGGAGALGGQDPVIIVEDDGRGLDLDAIRARAEDLGIPVPERGPAELVFNSELSTADSVSDIAGRGVGLAAVRAELLSIGWEISVTSERGKGAQFTLSPRRSGLPTKVA
jgi:HPt (histidine-containing phosphotransfer) domain-containing protein